MFQSTFAVFLTLLSCVLAAPVSATTAQNAWQYGAGGGVLGFIVLILDIIVWLEVLKSNKPTLHKLLWCLLVFLFPIGGVVIYYLFADRTHGGYEPIV